MEEEQKKNKRKTTFKTETHTRNKTQIHNKFARTLTNLISLSREDIPTGATAPHQKKNSKTFVNDHLQVGMYLLHTAAKTRTNILLFI